MLTLLQYCFAEDKALFTLIKYYSVHTRALLRTILCLRSCSTVEITLVQKFLEISCRSNLQGKLLHSKPLALISHKGVQPPLPPSQQKRFKHIRGKTLELLHRQCNMHLGCRTRNALQKAPDNLSSSGSTIPLGPLQLALQSPWGPLINRQCNSPGALSSRSRGAERVKCSTSSRGDLSTERGRARAKPRNSQSNSFSGSGASTRSATKSTGLQSIRNTHREGGKRAPRHSTP